MAIEPFVLEDGRQAERHITENGEQRVVEVYVEDVRPKRLTDRVTEKSRSMVVERTVEKLNEMGEVVEKKIESLEPGVRMELRRHIVQDDTMEDDAPAEMAPATVSAYSAPQHVSAFQAAAERSESKNKRTAIWTVVGMVLIAVQVATLGYFVFVF